MFILLGPRACLSCSFIKRIGTIGQHVKYLFFPPTGCSHVLEPPRQTPSATCISATPNLAKPAERVKGRGEGHLRRKIRTKLGDLTLCHAQSWNGKCLSVKCEWDTVVVIAGSLEGCLCLDFSWLWIGINTCFRIDCNYDVNLQRPDYQAL